jgi:myosin-15
MKCLNYEFLLYIVQVDLVKFSSVPIEQSLLRLEPGELSELAVECFAAVMRYMGDLPMAPDTTEVKCVYTILMVRINSRNTL